jgi:hypothetical protein
MTLATTSKHPPQAPIRALLPLALTQRRLLSWTLLAGLC